MLSVSEMWMDLCMFQLLLIYHRLFKVVICVVLEMKVSNESQCEEMLNQVIYNKEAMNSTSGIIVVEKN